MSGPIALGLPIAARVSATIDRNMPDSPLLSSASMRGSIVAPPIPTNRCIAAKILSPSKLTLWMEYSSADLDKPSHINRVGDSKAC
jgi:hypothetical protein